MPVSHDYTRQELNMASASYNHYRERCKELGHVPMPVFEYRDIYIEYRQLLDGYEEWYAANYQRYLAGCTKFSRRNVEWVAAIKELEEMMKP